MHIDKLLNSVKQQAKSNINNITLSVPSTWEQGRTLYGGISASLVYPLSCSLCALFFSLLALQLSLFLSLLRLLSHSLSFQSQGGAKPAQRTDVATSERSGVGSEVGGGSNKLERGP